MFSLHEQNCIDSLEGTLGSTWLWPPRGPAAIALVAGPISDHGERAVSFDLSFAPEVARFSRLLGRLPIRCTGV